MQILPARILTWAIISHSIDLSSQFEHLPDGAPIPGVSRSRTFNSLGRSFPPGMLRSMCPDARNSSVKFDPVIPNPTEFHRADSNLVGNNPVQFPGTGSDLARTSFSHSSLLLTSTPGRTPSLDAALSRPFIAARHSFSGSSASMPHLPARTFLPENSSSAPPPARRIALPSRLPSSDKRGYSLKYLKFIRLSSMTNPPRVFKFRRYTFAANSRLKLRLRDNTYEPIPPQEFIVLSTDDGEVYAILESTNALAGMYYYNNTGIRRAKINMEGRVIALTSQEIMETPVGPKRPITGSFNVERCKVI